MASAELQRRLAELAGRQHGAVARRQLIALGFGRRAIEHMIATGRLHPVHVGVYLVGHRAPGPHTRHMAALLAAGQGAALSHSTAALVFGLPPGAAAGSIELTVPRQTMVRRPGLRVHRCADGLDEADLTTREGLTLTAPARTLLDIAPRLDDRALRWAIEEARIRAIATTADLLSVTGRHPGRRGVAKLRASLDAVAGDPTLTRSEAERRLIDLVRRARLPRPRTNVDVAGWNVDLHWPEQRLVAEVDGFAYHGGRTAFERDRRKDADLQTAGQRVVRLSWRQVTREPAAVTALLARLLAAER